MTPAMFVIFYNIHKGAHHEFVTQTQGGAVMYYFNVLMENISYKPLEVVHVFGRCHVQSSSPNVTPTLFISQTKLSMSLVPNEIKCENLVI